MFSYFCRTSAYSLLHLPFIHIHQIRNILVELFLGDFLYLTGCQIIQERSQVLNDLLYLCHVTLRPTAFDVEKRLKYDNLS